jgi:hypothetical protein
VVLSVSTKYSTERKYLVPLECLRDLVFDLQRLNATATANVSAPDLGQPRPNSEAVHTLDLEGPPLASSLVRSP